MAAKPSPERTSVIHHSKHHTVPFGLAGPGVCGEGRYRADKLRSNAGARTYVRMHCMYEWYRDRRRAAQAGEKRRTVNAF